MWPIGGIRIGSGAFASPRTRSITYCICELCAALTARDFRRVVSEKSDLPVNTLRVRINYRIIADNGGPTLWEAKFTLLEGLDKQRQFSIL